MKKHIVISAVAVVFTIACVWLVIRSATTNHNSIDGSVVVKVQVEGVKERAELTQNPDGTFTYVLLNDAGEQLQLSPDEFAAIMYQQDLSDNFLAYLFNISTPAGIAWVCFGLFGQVMFSARMIVQWIVSEKSKTSIVPPAFWWLSIAGAIMLLSYFVWRRDIVGMLGQGTGLAIYLRNIYFIYRVKKPTSEFNHERVATAAMQSAMKS